MGIDQNVDVKEFHADASAELIQIGAPSIRVTYSVIQCILDTSVVAQVDAWLGPATAIGCQMKRLQTIGGLFYPGKCLLEGIIDHIGKPLAAGRREPFRTIQQFVMNINGRSHTQIIPHLHPYVKSRCTDA